MHLELINEKASALTKMPNLQFGDGDETKISLLTQYVHIVHRLMQEIGIDLHNDAGRLFFRGQANSDWRVEPSIFRDNQLSIEHKYVRASITRLPQEFSNVSSAFDRLTKLQHYGLPTRLLDVTHNPLVALYFACEKQWDEDDDGNSVEADGAIYVSYANPEFPESLNTQVLSTISGFDLLTMRVDELLSKLKESNIRVSMDDQLRNPLEHLQRYTRSHFVLPDLSNERIIRQCGAFLVCGCINIDQNVDEPEASIASKAKNDMKTEFSYRIVVASEEKESILEELDFYNINEATLFPEMEHQLKYIALSNKRYAQGTNDYRGIIQSEVLPIGELLEKDQEKFKTDIAPRIVSEIITDHEKSINVTRIVQENALTDWFKKDNVQAKLNAEIRRYLMQSGYESSRAKNTAKLIVDKLISEYSLEYAGE